MATKTKWEEIRISQVDFVERTLEEVELAKQESREPRVNSFLIKVAEYEKSREKPSDFQAPPPPPRCDVKATTLLEIFSVSIQRDTQERNDVGSSFEIYGHIKLTTDYGKVFSLFKCEHDDPVTVSMLDNRTAILPKSKGYCPRRLPKYFWLELYLADKSRNHVTIAQGAKKLDFQRKVRYDEEQTITIFNSRGYGRVTLNYTIFRCALLALTALGVSKNGSGIENSATDEFKVAVTGSISANTEVKGESGLSRVLCDIQSMSLTMNDQVATYLPVLAVPAYSLLRIKADLVVNGERIVTGDDALEFELVGSYPLPCRKEIMVGNWRIYLSVFWALSYAHLCDEDEFVGELPSYDFYYKALSRGEELLEREESLKSETQEKRFRPTDFARHLVEVFSVYVGSFRHECPLRVYGTIKYTNSMEDSLIFEREEMRPEIVFPNQPISLLERHHCHEAVDASFDMHIDLKDAGGREISKGCLEWDHCKAYYWSDKRACSVVNGEHGFACVHYAIFDGAVCAKLRVRLLSSSNNHHPVCEVSGSIYARYSTYRYSTDYEKNFYRSMLFKKKKKNLCALQTDMPLSKDAVAVPSYTSLILEVKIHVRAGGEFDETIRGELEFDPDNSTRICAKKIRGKNPRKKSKGKIHHSLQVEVEWS